MNCGYRDHSDLCLCDVKPKNVQLANMDYVRDMWHGKALCEVRGHGAPWTRNGILDYLEDLAFAYDKSRPETSDHFSPKNVASQAKIRMRWLSLNTEIGPSLIIKQVEQEFGIRFHTSSVCKIRKRAKSVV